MSKRRKNLIIATLLSILFHIGLFFLFILFNYLGFFNKNIIKEKPKEVTVVFPENKPIPKPKKFIITENRNENSQVPNKANLLSDKNSIAANKKVNLPTKPNLTYNEGNSAHEIASPLLQKQQKKDPFSSKSLTGKQVNTKNNKFGSPDFFTNNSKQSPISQDGLGQTVRQTKFSAEKVGGMTLNTYAWEWAPYLNKLKRKHHSVWTVPTAYSRLGLIHGYTVLFLKISKQGILTEMKVLEHKGHESLKDASVQSMQASFPFQPLPEGFPEEYLEINATLVYPDLRRRK